MMRRAIPILSMAFFLCTCFAGDDLDTQLVEAVKAGDNNKVKHLLHSGADPNWTADSDKDSPLAIALNNGDLDMADVLIGEGAFVNQSDSLGNTLLHRAAIMGSCDIARYLLNNGANIDAQNVEGSAALHEAAFAYYSKKDGDEYTDLVRLLLSKGANVNSANEGGFTPLHLASSMARYRIIYILLEYGADINLTANDGRTPLYYAIVDPNPELLKFLLDRGADPNIVMHNREHDGMSYLQIARETGNKEIVKLLESAGALESVQDTRN